MFRQTQSGPPFSGNESRCPVLPKNIHQEAQRVQCHVHPPKHVAGLWQVSGFRATDPPLSSAAHYRNNETPGFGMVSTRFLPPISAKTLGWKTKEHQPFRILAQLEMV